MQWIFPALILLLDVLTIIHIVQHHRNDRNTMILWIVLVLFLPVLGPILYALLGPEPRPLVP